MYRTRGLGLVGHNASDEVGAGGVQGLHQVVELILWGGGMGDMPRGVKVGGGGGARYVRGNS